MKGSKMDKWTLTLEFRNQAGETIKRCVGLNDDDIRSGMTPQLRDNLDLDRELGANTSGMTMNTMVRLMKKREFRRSSLVAEAERLAGSMADHMEDIEGWHGLDRAEKAARR
jgi:hypothetical protein